eukprot:CAMPEP_0198226436 /NCGR_PEP_ID=MMETSP1445-20131203/105261_1 /TAXON_ID=36898 /ORGANISM="Pyramimonas sp., Strain CCMP2087" /LENGTH=143 /DNA_ID=CAMNT_0043906245 /DNA_START=129 /DNA_END=560 /DNA_ORIENTATION=+
MTELPASAASASSHRVFSTARASARDALCLRRAATAATTDTSASASWAVKTASPAARHAAAAASNVALASVISMEAKVAIMALDSASVSPPLPTHRLSTWAAAFMATVVARMLASIAVFVVAAATSVALRSSKVALRLAASAR